MYLNQDRDVETVDDFLLPLPTPYKVSHFRVCFRFQLLSSKCFRFHISTHVLWKMLQSLLLFPASFFKVFTLPQKFNRFHFQLSLPHPWFEHMIWLLSQQVFTNLLNHSHLFCILFKSFIQGDPKVTPYRYSNITIIYFWSIISPINEYEKKIYCMDFYLKSIWTPSFAIIGFYLTFNMGIIFTSFTSHQFHKVKNLFT